MSTDLRVEQITISVSLAPDADDVAEGLFGPRSAWSLQVGPAVGAWYAANGPLTAREPLVDSDSVEFLLKFENNSNLDRPENRVDASVPALLRDLDAAAQTVMRQTQAAPPAGATTYEQLGNRALSANLFQDPEALAELLRRPSTAEAAIQAIARRVHRVAVLDALGRVIGQGLGVADKDLRSQHVSLTLRPLVGGAWRLGSPADPTQPYIPRLARHAYAQLDTAMVEWDVDTARTYGPGFTGAQRRSFGWDVVFGRAVRRGAEPVGDCFPFSKSPDGNVQKYLQRIHNGDKLRATREADSWIPWVLAYARSVGIPRRRIVATLATAQPVRFSSLQQMQDNAYASWQRRGTLDSDSSTWPWKLSSQHLLDRLLNGMSPHPPFVVLEQSTTTQAQPAGADSAASDAEPSLQGRFVWTFTWSAADGTHTYTQDGVFERGVRDAPGRMPDLEVWTHSVPLTKSSSGVYSTTKTLVIDRIRVRFPGETDFQDLKPPITEGADVPAADRFVTQWEFAKWFVRQAILATGQIDWHMARGHIYMEQLCAVLCGQLRGVDGGQDHPLLKVLWPFLRSADEINAFGDLTLLSEQGVLSRGACMAQAGTIRRMRLQRASWHWTAGPARTHALAPGDRFGKWSHCAWAATLKWAQDEVTEAVLGELVCTADCTPERDTPRGAALRKALQTLEQAHYDRTDNGLPVAEQSWWRTSGTAPAGAASSPVSAPYQAPKTLEDWQRFAAHIVYTATFLHSWVGGGQFTDMGSVFAASSGHRWRRLPTPKGKDAQEKAEWAKQEWSERGPLPAHGGFLVSLSELIGLQRWGAMADRAVRDNEGLHEASVETFWNRYFKDLGTSLDPKARERLHPNSVRSRINI